MIKTIIHDFQASCDIAFKVARERGTIVAGGIVQSGVFKHVKVANNVNIEHHPGQARRKGRGTKET